MNKRLKQLAIEAKLIAPEYNGFDHTRLSISQQKFAELIVRECIDTYDYWSTHSMDKTSFVVAKTHVKKHFGVKE